MENTETKKNDQHERRDLSTGAISSSDKYKILVVRFSSLGDIALTFQSIEYLLNRHPSFEIHFLTKKKFQEFVQSRFSQVQVHQISDHANLKELFQCLQKLKLLNFDFILDFHSNIRSRITSIFIGARVFRLSKSRLKEVFLFIFRKKLFLKFFAPISRLDNNKVLINKLLSAVELNFLGYEKKSVKRYLKNERIKVAICVESAWAQKQWSSDRFQKLGERVIQLGAQVVWLGIKPLPFKSQSHDLDLTSKINIIQVSQFLKESVDLLICNDSGLLHIAEDLNIPVISIFGPTSKEIGFAPHLEDSRIAEVDLWCRPCSKTGRLCFRILNKRKCLDEVSVDSVISIVEDHLRRAIIHHSPKRVLT